MKIEDRLETLENKLKSLEARYELLHGAVSKDVKGCEHRLWTYHHGTDIKFNRKCVMCQKLEYLEEDKPIPPCDPECECYEVKTNNGYELEKDHCQIHGQKHDKPTQTLAEKITEFLGYYKLNDLAKTINEWVETSLQSEYQRGYMEGRQSVPIAYRNGEKDGRKQAIEEIKARANKYIMAISLESFTVRGLYDALFTESK